MRRLSGSKGLVCNPSHKQADREASERTRRRSHDEGDLDQEDFEQEDLDAAGGCNIADNDDDRARPG